MEKKSIKDLKVSYHGEFRSALERIDGTLVLSVYQAGKLILLNAHPDGGIKITPISYPKPMGIAIDEQRLGIATKSEIHVYAENPKLSPKIELNGKHFDKIYFPRTTYHTGPLDLHDVRFIGKELWAVNTRFSCICSFDHEYSFIPRWKPHFISRLLPVDKCHLNGMAIEDGKPVYVTALGHTDEPQGWRDNITSGGVLMSIHENEIILDGLAMPHSPKIVGDYIYLLESARGALVRVDRQSMQKETVVSLNGLVRGLSIVGNTAFIGISKVREKSTTFSKLSEHLKAEKCSITAVDLSSGMILGQMMFDSFIEEIYDIDCFEGTQSVGIVGLYDERKTQAITTPREVFWKTKRKKDEAEQQSDNVHEQ